MNRITIFIIVVTVIAIVAILLLTVVLTPAATNPAAETAVEFVEAAAMGDDARALSLAGDAIRAYAAACPDGSLNACVRAYTPPEWGGMLSAVFRRAAPNGGNWNIDVITTYAEDRGFSGVCVSTKVEPDADSPTGWAVTEYAGFIHCGETGARTLHLTPNAPNRVP